MRILILLFLVCFSSPGFSSVGDGYRSGSAFGKRVKKGEKPEKHKFLQRGKKVSHLTSLNDTTLAGEGAKAAREEEMLHMSEEAKLDAFSEHDIGPSNQFLKASAELEANPLLQTGGKYGTTQQRVKIKTKERKRSKMRTMVLSTSIMRN